MQFNLKYEIARHYLPRPSNRRRGLPMVPGVRFIVVHDTGNPGSTARQNVRYYARTADVTPPASAHLFVDDREIIECIPAMTGAPEKAWHVQYSVPVDDHLFGHNANDAAIGIEYCYGGAIDADEAYRRYVWLISYACHRWGLDPARSVVGHHILDPKRKTDPVTGLARSRRSYDQLLIDVVAEYRECRGEAPAPSPAVNPEAGEVTTTVALNIRAGAPNSRAPIRSVAAAGTRLAYVGLVRDGEPVNGNGAWYQNADGDFFWSGATRPLDWSKQ